MKEDKKFVEKLRDRSGERPQRVVIDEVLPGGLVRVLCAEMRSGADEMRLTDPVAWGEEKERHVSEEQLAAMLTDEQLKQAREGHVFLIKKGRATSIRKEVRDHMKEKAKGLLAKEGKTAIEARGGR